MNYDLGKYLTADRVHEEVMKITEVMKERLKEGEIELYTPIAVNAMMDMFIETTKINENEDHLNGFLEGFIFGLHIVEVARDLGPVRCSNPELN
jgi:hypothetical protein